MLQPDRFRELPGDSDPATPTLIVVGPQDVRSWRKIYYFAPRKFASPAEWDIYASARFTFEIQLNLIQATTVIDRD